MIKIIVDSTCDLPKEYRDKYDIKVLPLRVLLEEKEYRDGIDIQIEEVYDEMRKGILPKTSQVNPGDMNELFKSYCEAGHDFMYITFSSKLSGTHDLAKMVVGELKEKYPNIKMEVIDSKGGALGTGIIALEAAKMAVDGIDFSTIQSRVEFMVSKIEHIFTLTDLEWLTKGGRIGKATSVVGGILNIKPILIMEDGIMKVVKTVRGRKKSFSTIISMVEERIKNFTPQIIGVSHADDLETAEEMVRLLKEKFPECDFIIDRIGSVLGSHLGIGGVGVLFMNEKPEDYKMLSEI